MSKKFFFLVIGGFAAALVIVLAAMGGFAFFAGNAPGSNPHPLLPTANYQQPTPGLPQISLTIRKLPAGNSLIVEWTNLPATTAALDLFCSALLKPEPSSSWTLWKEILLSSGKLAAGNREVQLGVWYKRCSFYVVQAITAQKVGILKVGATTTLDFAGGINGAGSTVLWTSGITLPGVTTSTIGLPPPPAPPSAPPPPSNQPSGGPNNPHPTSTPPAPTSTPITNPQQPTTSFGGIPPNTPSGTPYYNPQVQVYGYAASGSPIFWVQHAGQGTEIGWQNIPPDTDTIVILRADSASGPWNQFMTQKNLPTNNYSFDIVDSAAEQAYYYEMQAISGSSTIATYGPDYLAPLGQ